VIGQWINSRNDRAVTNQELDIVKKLDSNSTAARELREVVEFRIAGWRQRMTKSAQLLRSGIVLYAVGTMLILLASQFVIQQAFPQRSWLFQSLAFLSYVLMVSGLVAWIVSGLRLGRFFAVRHEERAAARHASAKEVQMPEG
jgi:hypothetical protein